jgi:hypothetical protein
LKSSAYAAGYATDNCASYHPRMLTGRIDVEQRAVRGITVGIETPTEADRVTFPISTDAWVVVSEIVVAETGLLVGVLPREP